MTFKLASGQNWPTQSHRLLLRAILLDGDRALDAWQTWRDPHDIESIDAASFSVLPQLYLNLTKLGIEDEQIGRLRGIYRQTWVRNNLMLHGLSQVVELLNGEGIQTVVLKGMPLALFYYEDLGARYMGDLDVAVSEADFAAAVDALRREGWFAELEFPPKHLWQFFHALHFQNSDGLNLDLHRRVFDVDVSSQRDGEVLQRAVEQTYGNVTIRIPDATDLLLITCFHARKTDAQSVCRWVVDVTTLLNRSPAIDWGEVLQRTQSLGQLLPVRDALTYLDQHAFAPVPREFLERAWSIPASASDERRYRRLTILPNRPFPIATMHSRYSDVCLANNEQDSAWGFLRYLLAYYRWRYRVRSRWPLPFDFVPEVWRRRIRSTRESTT